MTENKYTFKDNFFGLLATAAVSLFLLDVETGVLSSLALGLFK